MKSAFSEGVVEKLETFIDYLMFEKKKNKIKVSCIFDDYIFDAKFCYSSNKKKKKFALEYQKIPLINFVQISE